MRLIKQSTLKSYYLLHPDAEEALKDWIAVARHASWVSSNDLKSQIGSASVIGAKRVVFNIAGNKYRLIIDCQYDLQIIFIVWIGTHNQYDNINAKTVVYQAPYK